MLPFAALVSTVALAHVPVILPDRLDYGAARVYAAPLQVRRNYYRAAFWDAPACNETAVCRLGHMTAQPADRRRPPGQAVRLAQFGTTAYLRLGACALGCGDSEIAFDYRGYRYRFGIKGASRAWLLAQARHLRLFLTPLQRERRPRARPVCYSFNGKALRQRVDQK